MNRPSWDEYFLQICEVVATRSTCDRKRVGAIIVRDKQILSTGYNGSLPKTPHCDDLPEFWECRECGKKYSLDEVETDRGTWPTIFTGKPECLSFTCRRGLGMVKKNGGHIIKDGHCVRAIHAERNAIAQAAKHGVSIENAILYCNTKPCPDCLALIISAGIREVVYGDDYGDKTTEKLAKDVDSFLLRQVKKKEGMV